jgi:rhodanese-related sulfurtransferase
MIVSSVVRLRLDVLLAGLALLVYPLPLGAQSQTSSQEPFSIFRAGLGELYPKTPEISTEELQTLLASDGAILLDVRPHLEWAISHIPGALNVAPKPGMPMSQYTSDVVEVGRLVGGDKTRLLVLYCNGPFCGKSKRVSEELLASGYTSVRRYQLGVPVWRALGGAMVIELDGVRYVLERDQTAVFIDARDPEEFRAGSLAGARSLPRSKVLPGKDVGEVKAAKDDGRLPMEDHNTRIIVFGRDAQQARAVAEALTQEAFHNVSYFEGDFRALRTRDKN